VAVGRRRGAPAQTSIGDEGLLLIGMWAGFLPLPAFCAGDAASCHALAASVGDEASRGPLGPEAPWSRRIAAAEPHPWRGGRSGSGQCGDSQSALGGLPALVLYVALRWQRRSCWQGSPALCGHRPADRQPGLSGWTAVLGVRSPGSAAPLFFGTYGCSGGRAFVTPGSLIGGSPGRRARPPVAIAMALPGPGGVVC